MLKAAAVAGIIFKATEGTGNTDKSFAKNWADAHANGVIRDRWPSLRDRWPSFRRGDRDTPEPTWAHTTENDPAGLYDDQWEPRK